MLESKNSVSFQLGINRLPVHLLQHKTPISIINLHKILVFLGILFLLFGPAQAGQKEDELINRFRVAYENQDANALLELAYPVGLNEILSSNLKSQFQFYFMLKLKLNSIKILDVPEGITLEQSIDGVIYKPMLKPTSALEVKLYTIDSNRNKSLTGNIYLIGEHNDTLYITPDVPY